jgi:CheY-like chemotaxis protein
VESTVGVGSVFRVELQSSPAPELTEISPEAPVAAEPPRKPPERVRTLLYVEDNPANMELVKQLVARRPDMQLLEAVNGTLGVELAREAGPDMILMDINLPGISGIDAMKILRNDPVTAHIPVVALSTNAMPRDIETGIQAGFFRYLTKPINVGEFMETVDLALEFAEKQSHV